MTTELKFYRKKETQPMFEWFPGFDMDGVSVSAADKANGSPKPGDRIAVNRNDPSDMWLVAKEFFAENYEEVTQ